MRLIFATQNQNKVKELQQLMPGTIELLSLKDINCDDDIPETAPDLQGNASQKSAYVVGKFKVDCFADDTGLEIESLNGEPGIYSARYAGEHKSAEANMEKVLDKLENIENRNAQFKTVIALIIDGKETLLEGVAKGEITKEKSGSEGFGYDPIFKPEGYDITFSEMGLTVEEVDKLTGPVMGRPKSATFRTCDVVGLDTLVHVANGVKDNCKKDEQNGLFTIPDYVSKMVEKNMLGSKTKQGFYKKVKGDDGKSKILTLDLNTLEYREKQKAKFPTLELTKSIDDLKERTKVLAGGKDKAGEFYRKSFYGLFAYVSNRIPEITDALYKIDDALCAGFAWQLGPFTTWDVLGVEKTLPQIEAAGFKVDKQRFVSTNPKFAKDALEIINRYSDWRISKKEMSGMEAYADELDDPLQINQ